MSKHINMTGHYKVAGRDRQGEGILQASQKGAFAQQRHETRLQAIESQAGPPAWETTPPNLEITDRPKPPAKKAAQKKVTKKVTKRNSATTRKARKSATARTGKRAAKVARRSSRRSRSTGR